MLPNGPCLTHLGSHLLWCMLWTPCDQTLLSVQYACTVQKVIGWFKYVQLSTPVNIKVWPLTNGSKKYVVLLLLIRNSFTKLDHIVACVLAQSSDTHSILVWVTNSRKLKLLSEYLLCIYLHSDNIVILLWRLFRA